MVAVEREEKVSPEERVMLNIFRQTNAGFITRFVRTVRESLGEQVYSEWSNDIWRVDCEGGARVLGMFVADASRLHCKLWKTFEMEYVSALRMERLSVEYTKLRVKVNMLKQQILHSSLKLVSLKSRKKRSKTTMKQIVKEEAAQLNLKQKLKDVESTLTQQRNPADVLAEVTQTRAKEASDRIAQSIGV